MGYPHVANGLADPCYRFVLDCLDTGRCWVKLSPRISEQSVLPFADVLPFVHDLVRRAPNRLLWGSDWPHPNYFNPMPNDADLVDLLAEWAPDKTSGSDHGGEPEGAVRVQAGSVGFRMRRTAGARLRPMREVASRETRRRNHMPNVKVEDIAYARFQAPDLDRAEEFLLDFGLVRAERTPTTLYMRGTDPAPFIEVIHLGEPRLLGSAWYVESSDDLKALSKLPGASGIETVDEPGGGQRVRLKTRSATTSSSSTAGASWRRFR